MSWSSYLVARESEYVNSRCPARFQFAGRCEFPSDVEIARNYSPSALSANMPVILMHYRTGRMGTRNTDLYDQVGVLSMLIVSRSSACHHRRPRHPHAPHLQFGA